MPKSSSCANLLCGFVVVVIFFAMVGVFFWSIAFLIEIKKPRSDPMIWVEQVYIPALSTISNDPDNTTIFLEFKLENGNKDKGIYYSSVKVNLYYGENELAYPAPVATVYIDGFYQGYHKTAYRTETFDAVGVPWDIARNDVSNGTAVFRVGLTTTVRYRITSVKYGKRKVAAGGNLRVNARGSLVKPDDAAGLKLSSAPMKLSYCAYMGLFLAFVLLFL